MSRQKYKAEQVIEALEKAGGVLAVAARALGCSRQAVYNYINRYPTVRDAYEQANEVNLDVAESILLKQVRAGDKDQVRFYLRTKGKRRGYGDKLEIDGRGVIDVNVTWGDASNDD